MADFAGIKSWPPAPFFVSPARQDEAKAAGGGSIAVHFDRVLKTKRSFPVVPTERTQVFTG
jgi:hypothetical protein